MALTDLEGQFLMNLKPEAVMSVYSGRAGRCCCGCSGIHRYNPLHRGVASKRRGYEVKKDEINGSFVRRVLTILQGHFHQVNASGNHFSLVLGKRLYVVYPYALRNA